MQIYLHVAYNLWDQSDGFSRKVWTICNLVYNASETIVDQHLDLRKYN